MMIGKDIVDIAKTIDTGLKALTNRIVALISSGGIALKTDRPFDQEGERKSPWWGDLSYRIIPQTARTEDIRVYFQHTDPRDLTLLYLQCVQYLHRAIVEFIVEELWRASCYKGIIFRSLAKIKKQLDDFSSSCQ